jgi:hypothetical protein
MNSAAFEGLHLSDLEQGMRNHHDLGRLLPMMTVDNAPAEAQIGGPNVEFNAELNDAELNDAEPNAELRAKLTGMSATRSWEGKCHDQVDQT